MPPEETLDPADWETMRALGHRMLDDMLDHMQSARERCGWQHAPAPIKEHFTGPLPVEPAPLEQVYEEFLEYVLPYPFGNDHPRFWGWVLGTGTVTGALADFLASAMNTSPGGVDYHSANYVEQQVIDWMKEIMGFPPTSSGLLTSGCSAANLIGLAVARNSVAERDVRVDGLHQSGAGMMTFYASSEVHSSIQKAVELLGVGSTALRRIAVDDGYAVDVKAMAEAIRRDRDDGFTPTCVIGAAGTTNTGAIDDLSSLADLCREQKLWLHVDGAFGAWAILAPDAAERLAGMERADSLAFDLHKWIYLPYEIGCLLVRDEEGHRRAFSLTPDYLAHGEGGRGMTGGDMTWFSDYGFQLSRGFRALKAWMSFKEHGVDMYARLIQQNIDQAHYLGSLVDSSERLKLMAPIALNVVCFRYVHPDVDETALDAVNKEIVVQLQEDGIAVPSGTVLNERYVIHVAITNHRSRQDDFGILVSAVLKLGNHIIVQQSIASQ